MDEAALNLYEKLHHGIFEHSIYIKSQIAKIYYSLRGEHLVQFLFEKIDGKNLYFDLDGIQAASKFSEIHKEDPYCLDSMDVYSNVLYVQINQPELAQLAHQAFEVDKYRVETCCIVGKFLFAILNFFFENLRFLKLTSRILKFLSLRYFEIV